MAHNTEEEHLENPTNNQSEDFSNEIIATHETETIKPNQEIENMEVHKHPHHVTHKKKWGEYLLEFFMLFLAVFLGFLVENYREHQVEKDKAKQYVRSFYDDLKTDTAEFARITPKVFTIFNKRALVMSMYFITANVRNCRSWGIRIPSARH